MFSFSIFLLYYLFVSFIFIVMYSHYEIFPRFDQNISDYLLIDLKIARSSRLLVFFRSVFYGEYNCKGAGATMERRVGYVRKLTDAEAKPFITLGYIEGSKWLLPPVAL